MMSTAENFYQADSMPIKISDVRWKSNISTMRQQNIILLVVAFLTTTYGKAHKYVCPFNALLPRLRVWQINVYVALW